MTRRGRISLLIFMFCVCGSFFVAQHYLSQRSARPADLYAIVHSQFKALRADDFAAAYQGASDSFREKFNVADFIDLIQRDYPQVLSAERIEFGLVEQRGKRAVLQVFLIDRQGRVTPAIYHLVNEAETWKIDSAQLLPQWPAGQTTGAFRI